MMTNKRIHITQVKLEPLTYLAMRNHTL